MGFLSKFLARWPRLEKWLPRSLSIGLAIVLLVCIYAFNIEPNWYEVQQVTLTLPHLPAAFDRYRIVQLTDIHVDNRMNPARLQRITKLVNQQQPDLIVMTGDYVTRRAERYLPNLALGLQHLQAPDGLLAVLGNHDHWINPQLVIQTLQSFGVQVLNNSLVTIQRDHAQLQVAGLDDLVFWKADLKPILAQMGTAQGAILLAHEPDSADTNAATGKFDLQLSGHAHGGQIRFLGIHFFPKRGRIYPVGQYQVGPMIQYTSRGIGAVPPRGRLNCRPEITVLTLRSPLVQAQLSPQEQAKLLSPSQNS
jgi:predicted MPP superfamily phosphohydrolase